MKKCVFTIVAKNYIGLAEILGQSLNAHHPDTDFFIFVADELNDSNNIELPDNVIIVKDINCYTVDEWTEMTFKYNLTEFCTAIKPACFQHLFALDYQKVIYFDPDIYIFTPLNDIFYKMETFDVILTPQIAGIHVIYEGEHPEWAMNVNGIFNLGFCGMKNTDITHRITEWWKTRLKDNCFADRSTGNFTDQKWMDWMPGLLGNSHLYIMQHLGMNMAPWNFFERELFMSEDRVMVRFRTPDNPQSEVPLVFLHFAGYNYSKLKKGVIERKRIENLQEYKDLSLATDVYKQAIMDNSKVFDSFIHLQYSYDTYENGYPISSFHRRLYHGLVLSGKAPNSPFSAGKDSFFSKMKKKNMVEIQKFDNLNQRNIPKLEKKKNMINMLFTFLYKLMGYKRYAMFLKSLYNYCRPELHTFLLK